MRIITSIFALAIITGCSAKPVSQTAPVTPLPQTLEAAVASPFRTTENRLRDKYRHPTETLTFFGIQPSMTVVEIWPSGGWYTQILAPYLAANGEYIGAVNPKSSPENTATNTKLNAWLKGHFAVAAKSKLLNFDPATTTDIVPAGSADMVLTFRNVHNWEKAKASQAAFNAFYRALKPGGVLGVVEHRANRKSKPDSGYMKEKYVIALAKKAGFKLAAKSEINANSRDTKDYPNGVWTLPPVNRHDKNDDAKYAAIGESDRMTLKFVKPIN